APWRRRGKRDEGGGEPWSKGVEVGSKGVDGSLIAIHALRPPSTPSTLPDRRDPALARKLDEDQGVMARNNELRLARNGLHPVLRLEIGDDIQGLGNRGALLEVLVQVHVVGRDD